MIRAYAFKDAPRAESHLVGDLSVYLKPTPFLDSTHPRVADFVAQVCAGARDAVTRAQRLYLAVRDDIRYDPYRVDLTVEALRASAVLERGYGYCVAKAVLLGAAARAAGIPARLGFGDVRNHLTTERLKRSMKTDVFVWHGYTELWLDGAWVKATPAFNRTLCERFNVAPLEWDGRHDALFQEFDRNGRRYMEYLNDRGRFDDVPLEQIIAAFAEYYPVEKIRSSLEGSAQFEDEAPAS